MKEVDLNLESGYHSIKSIFNVLEAEFPRVTFGRFWNVYHVSVFPEPARELNVLYLVIRIPND